VRALDCRELGYIGMPADCWSTGVVVFAMLTLVYHCLLAVSVLNMSPCRGSHPFDFEDPLDSAECLSFDAGVDSQGCGIGWSQDSYIRDDRTKRRILDGTVTFCEIIWSPLKDGAYTIIAVPAACSTFYFVHRFLTKHNTMNDHGF